MEKKGSQQSYELLMRDQSEVEMDFDNRENPTERTSLFDSLDPIGINTAGEKKIKGNEEERKSMT